MRRSGKLSRHRMPGQAPGMQPQSVAPGIERDRAPQGTRSTMETCQVALVSATSVAVRRPAATDRSIAPLLDQRRVQLRLRQITNAILNRGPQHPPPDLY
jgi:hypothetical protein